jgi:hypothetical protein
MLDCLYIFVKFSGRTPYLLVIAKKMNLLYHAFSHMVSRHVTQVLCPFESILLWPPGYHGILCRHLSKYNSSGHVRDLLSSQVHNLSQFHVHDMTILQL